jgi:hypothetical protein
MKIPYAELISFTSQTPAKGQFHVNGIYRSGNAVGTAKSSFFGI